MADEEREPRGRSPTDDSAKTYLENTVTKVLHDALVELNEKRPSAPVRFLVDYLSERAERVDGEIAARAAAARAGDGDGDAADGGSSGNA